MYNGVGMPCRFRACQHPSQLTLGILSRRSLRSQSNLARTPKSPPNVSKSAPAKPKTKPKRKWLRRLAWTTALVAGGYVFDTQLNNASLTRSFRTFQTGLVIALDYKINFRAHPPFANSLNEVHHRNAERIFNLLRENGGLYLKIGQAIAMQSAVLPPEFQKMFSRMFDDAPQNDWHDVEKVVQEDFGKSVEEVFGVSFQGEEGKGVMERTARASASVAQVHWARLPDGTEVAVKIQKREIKNQVVFDLWAFRVITRVFTWLFEIPMYSMVPYVSERLMLETDFENEADNAETMKRLVENEPRLRGRVYVPTVYRSLSSKRVMTAEWIEGTRLWDKEEITNPWRRSKSEGSPGCNGRPLPPRSKEMLASVASNDPHKEQLKPDRTTYWRGADGKGGLGLSLKDVMETMVDLFSAQLFLWGILHADPHPGNIFIRRLPHGKSELVLIDHGLYIYMDAAFRHQYALFWKSLIAFDNTTVTDIVRSWGVRSPDLFASATLMRPYTGGDKSTSEELRKGVKGKTEGERAYEMQMKMRAGIKQILSDETKWPKELIFIGRNLRIVQGNNQYLGSPVNRIKITGLWASRALAESKDLPLLERFSNWIKHLRFRAVLVGSDAVWWYAWIRQKLGFSGGMEEEIEAQMKVMAKDMGIELNHEVFSG